MVRITPGPLDVRPAQLSTPAAVTDIARSRAGENLRLVSDKVGQIVDAARTQQIENDVVEAELQTRKGLDALRVQLDKDPDNETLPQRWAEGAEAVVNESAARLTSPAHQRMWRERANNLLNTEREAIGALQRRRIVEAGVAGLITSVASAQATMTSEDATPEARAEAFQLIESAISRAVERRTIGVDDAARMRVAAIAARDEYAQTQGMRATVQDHVTRVWEASGQNFGVAAEMVREELSGTIENDVLSALRQMRADQDTSRSQNIEEAMGRSYAAIENGTPISALPSSDLAIITDAGMVDSLRAYQSNMAGESGAAGATRESAFIGDRFVAISGDDAGAVRLAQRDVDVYAPLPDAVALALDLAPGTILANVLMPDDVRKVQERQAYLRGEGPEGAGDATMVDRAYTRIWDVAQARASVADGYLTGDATRRRERGARLQVFVRRAAQEFVEREHRLPRVPEINDIVEDALIEGRVGGVRPFLQSRAIPGSRAAWELEVEEGERFRPRFDQIPSGIRTRIAAALRRRLGRNPYEQEVEDEYQAFTASLQ